MKFAPNNLSLLYDGELITEKKLGCHSKIFINTTKCIYFLAILSKERIPKGAVDWKRSLQQNISPDDISLFPNLSVQQWTTVDNNY